jgi:mRNA-degrading endonuclease toxin of MazEF toxin-antitoxin module
MTIKYGDLHWVEFPFQDGREQRGRRPALIWLDDRFLHLPTLLLIPFTSKLSSLRFDGTLLIQPTVTNALASPSVALVFQLGAWDRNRIKDRMGQLDVPDLLAVADIARKLQRL